MAAVPAFALSATIPFPRRVNPPVLLAIPSANVLSHGQYMLSGRFQYFTSSVIGDTAGGEEAASTEVTNVTYNSELLFGIENRAELGVQYGQEISLSIKALLVREDLFWPDLVFGVRNILGSPEGGLYGLEEGEILRSLYGESYMTMAKNFPSSSRVHLGISYLNAVSKGSVSVNAGLEQDMGAGAYLGYEVFERFSDFHQVMTLNWRYKDLVALSLGLTEFQSWIRQDGEWGFFLTPTKSRRDGYNSPGITVALQVQGFAPRRQKRTVPERVAILEVRNVELERKLAAMEETLQRVESQAASQGDASGAEPMAASPREIREKAVILLRTASDKMAMEISNPDDVRQIMYSIISMGPPGSEALRSIAADTAAGSVRVPAILTMAFSRDSAFGPPLRALCGDKDARIRREALTALTKVQPRAALEDARRLLGDPDETVAMAAGEAYRLLGGVPETDEEAKSAARTGAASKPAAKPAPAEKTAAKTASTPKAAPKAPAKTGKHGLRAKDSASKAKAGG